MASINVASQASLKPVNCRRVTCGRVVQLKQFVRAPAHHRAVGVPRTAAMAASLEEQDKAFRKAEKRWQNQIAEGKVKNVDAKTAGDLLKEGWVLLDVRPRGEVEKVGVQGSIEVPVFVPEDEVSINAFLKQASAFGMGGWWLGGTHMKPNPNFLAEVQAKIPKDARVLVTCQKGLRSLSAAEQLSRAGYPTLAWINGGFDTAAKGDLPTVPEGKDLRYAGVGGVSEALGWTEVQRQEGKSLFDGDRVVKFGLAVLVVDLLAFAYEYIQAAQSGGLPQ